MAFCEGRRRYRRILPNAEKDMDVASHADLYGEGRVNDRTQFNENDVALLGGAGVLARVLGRTKVGSAEWRGRPSQRQER